MSYPVMSYGQWFMTDCDDLTGWIKQTSPAPTLTADLAVDNDDYFKITATGGTGSVYWEKDFTNIESNFIKKFKLRYKTSNTSIKAKIELVFTDGSQEILPASDSLNWKAVEGTNTPEKTLDKIRIYATSATGEVYYDFILIHENDFTFPSTESVIVYLPEPRDVELKPPLKTGIISQILGADLATVHIRGDMSLGDWGTPKGQFFYHVWHYSYVHVWQWLVLPEHGLKFKVRVSGPSMIPAQDGKISFDIVFKEHRLGDVSKEESVERFGMI